MMSFLRTSVGLLFVTVALAASCKNTGSDPSGSGGGETCKSPQQVCEGACVDPRFDPKNCGACGNACTDGKVCFEGICEVSCPAGSEKCALEGAGGGAALSVCANVAVDRNHCGACGTKCPAAEVCTESACALECAGGATKCDAKDGPVCVDTMVDALNCGGCAAACEPGFACVSGACKTVCVAGTTVCSVPVPGGGAGGGGGAGSTSSAGGAGGLGGAGGAGGAGGMGGAGGAPAPMVMDICVDTQLDPRHCGNCETACPKGKACQGGQCLTDCVGGTSKCADENDDDVCVKLLSDEKYCGTCTNACAPKTTCVGGVCEVACQGGSTECGGTCVNTANDPAHCGGCGMACTGGKVCQDKQCVLKCVGGSVDCLGSCVNTANDPANCGGCGMACTGGKVCQDKQCVLKCVGGSVDCLGSCVTVANDPNNCGLCGSACAKPPNATGFCASMTCGFGCKVGFGDCNALGADGCEAPLNTVSACGSCGKACTSANATSTCVNATCGLGACNTGFGNCNANATDGCEVNLKTDSANCGTCGNACAGNAACVNGVCGASTCKVVAGAGNLTWCAHAAATKNTSCSTVCQSVGLVAMSNTTTWFNAQNDIAECTALRDAFGFAAATPTVLSQNLACAGYESGQNQLICSSSTACPGNVTANAPGSATMTPICACQ